MEAILFSSLFSSLLVLGDGPAHRLPAEFEPIEGVVLAVMPHEPERSFVLAIAAEVVAVAKVVLVISGPREADRALADLSARLDDPGFLSRVDLLEAEVDSVWMRNYGAHAARAADGSLVLLDASSSRFFRPRDDAFPAALARHLGVELAAWPLVIDGGNVMTDGQGTFFTTEMTYVWNGHPGFLGEGIANRWGPANGQRELSIAEIHAAIGRATGQTHIVVLPFQGEPYDGTGHLNMFAKLVAPRTILLSQSPQGGFNHRALAEARRRLDVARNAAGEPFEVIPLPCGGDPSGRLGYQYANSLLVNGPRGKKALVPVYGIPADREALSIYRRALPDYKIVGIESTAMLAQNGTVHCVTQVFGRDQVGRR